MEIGLDNEQFVNMIVVLNEVRKSDRKTSNFCCVLRVALGRNVRAGYSPRLGMTMLLE